MTRRVTAAERATWGQCWHCGDILDPAGDTGDGLHPMCAYEVETAAAAALGPLPGTDTAVETLAGVLTGAAAPRVEPVEAAPVVEVAGQAPPTYGTRPQPTRGGDPHVLADELIWHVRDYLAHRPRSLQRRIGPSSLGTPCARRVGHILAGTPSSDTRPPGWLPGIGVAVHSMLEKVVARVNGLAGRERFITERRVEVGTVDGQAVTGTCDLYDVDTATVVDWKVVGKSTLDAVRRKGPSLTYLTQAQLYGYGYARAGYDVERVGILYLPRGEELDHARYAVEPYDEQVARAAVERADGIAQAVRLLGPAAVLPTLNRADDCRFCEYRNTPPSWADADDLDPLDGCPGIDRRRTNIDGLVARA